MRAIAAKSIALAVVLGTTRHGIAQDAKTAYPNMAPIEQYLMDDRNAEVTLARSAAPESISRDAEILVLGRHGYETAVKGRTVSCASWNVPGHLQSTTRASGIREGGLRSA
jgi:hypothetical protein